MMIKANQDEENLKKKELIMENKKNKYETLKVGTHRFLNTML